MERNSMKKRYVLLVVVLFFIVIWAFMVVDRIGLFESSGGPNTGMVSLKLNYDWRSLTFSSNAREYKALFKLDSGYRDKSGTVPRVQIERVIDTHIYLICEYVQDEQRTSAQRFDIESGRYIESLDQAPFRALADAMQVGTTIQNRNVWELGDRAYDTAVNLATDIATRCDSPVRMSKLDPPS
jgi:hypothetical protein